MTVTTLGKRSSTTLTISSSDDPLDAGGVVAIGRPTLIGADRSGGAAARYVRYVAAAPPEIPPMRAPTRSSAATRPPFTRELPARDPRCFRVRAGSGLAAPR